MSLFRAALVALMIVALAVAPYLVPNSGWTSARGASVYAAPAAAPAVQDNDDEDDADDDDNGLSNDQDDNDDDDDDVDDNEDNDNGGNDNDDDDDDGNDVDGGDDGNGNDNDAIAPFVNAPTAPAAAATSASACSTPGQESSFNTDDGRITVRVFSSMPQSVRFSVLRPIEAGIVPSPPGQVVGGLLFQLIAESCDGGPIPSLPAEVNLGVRYGDADAAGLNEQAFTLARLDTSANQWRTVEKQAADPPANYASATIRDMGYYVLYQRS